MAEQWLSISEYARTFGVSDMTVRRRVKTGRLHAVLKEGKYFIPVQQAQMSPSASVPQPQPQPHQHHQHQNQQQAKRAGGEMQVIKGHPQAHKTFMAPVAREPEPTPQPHVRADYLAVDDQDSVIPQSLRRPLHGAETSLVDTRALIAFCEATMRKVSEGERRTVEKFKSKLEALEATLVSKDMEIKSLRQQVEDLQLLVKILEKKRAV